MKKFLQHAECMNLITVSMTVIRFGSAENFYCNKPLLQVRDYHGHAYLESLSAWLSTKREKKESKAKKLNL